MLRPALVLGLSTLALGALAGCRDADGDPLAVLVAAETHGALAAAERLPRLPEMIGGPAADPELGRANRLWLESWNASGDDAREKRAEAYRGALPGLAAKLKTNDVEEALAAVWDVLGAAASIEPDQTPAFVQEGLLIGRVLAEEAQQALEAGDAQRGLLLTLQAADRLRELAPREVATRLISEAEEALGRKPGDDTYSELDMERSRHLLISAGQAMDDSDYLRAIRRAYYACRLLGVDLE